MNAVIFDMDGVLADNMAVHRDVFGLFARKYGVDISDDELNTLAGMGNDQILPRIFPKNILDKYSIEALGNEKEQMYRDYYAPKIKEVAGLTTFLKLLTTNGIKCAVGSSGQEKNVDFALDALHIRPYFSAIVNGDMVTRRKPDPEIFLTAAQMLGIAPTECVVMEDSISGIEAAKRAGMKVVGLATTFSAEELAQRATPDKIVKDFTELGVAIF